MPKAAIFDIDGTMIDSVDLHARAWQDAFRKFGKEISFEDIRIQIGKGGDQLMPVFCTQQELDQFGEELEEWRGDHFKEAYLPQVRPFPKVRDLFQHIREEGIRIVLASSAKGDELEAYVRIADVEEFVDNSASGDDVKRSKPYPDVFLEALKKLTGITADDCLAVGDTPYDATAARTAGIDTIGMLCGGFPKDLLVGAGCIAIYRDPADLLDRFEESAFCKPLRGVFLS